MDYGAAQWGVSKRGGQLLLWNSHINAGRSYRFAFKRGQDPTVWYCYDCHALNKNRNREGQPTGSVVHVKVRTLELTCLYNVIVCLSYIKITRFRTGE